MNYYHWARRPVTLRRKKYLQSGQPKPNGFWFDVDGDWQGWCETTGFRPETFRYRHKVTILDPSGIIFLRRAKDIDAFTRRYARNLSGSIRLMQSSSDNDEFARRYGRDLFGDILRQFSNYIMWKEVAEEHSGIVVAPYSRSRRETYLWYHGWSCASGCIWDTNAIRLGKPRKMAE
jgi:hypothetical protein